MNNFEFFYYFYINSPDYYIDFVKALIKKLTKKNYNKKVSETFFNVLNTLFFIITYFI